MNGVRRVTANIPRELLTEATEVTGQGITATLIEGLELIRRRRAYSTAMRLRGKLDLEVELESSRERHHR